MTTPRFIFGLSFWLLLILAVVQVAFYYPQLPDSIASHFDGAGRADGWMSKNTFLIFNLAMLALTVLCFWALPKIRWPDRLVSLPHKDHWLASERREETRSHFKGQILVFGCASLILLLVVTQWVIEANLDGSQTLSSGPMWWLLGAYGLFTVVWATRLIRHYYRVPTASS